MTNIIARRARRPAPVRARGAGRRRRARRPGARRAVTAGAADMPTWRAIGADRGIAVRALVLPRAASRAAGRRRDRSRSRSRSRPRFPISQARRYDLDVGIPRRLARVVGRAIVAVIAFVMSIARAAALRRGEPAPGGPRRRRRRRCRRLARAGLPPRARDRLAPRGRARARAPRGPVRSALIGAIVGVLGVVGCFTFRAGLTDAAAARNVRHRVELRGASGEGPVARQRRAHHRRRTPTSARAPRRLGPHRAHQRRDDTDVRRSRRSRAT